MKFWLALLLAHGFLLHAICGKIRVCGTLKKPPGPPPPPPPRPPPRPPPSPPPAPPPRPPPSPPPGPPPSPPPRPPPSPSPSPPPSPPPRPTPGPTPGTTSLPTSPYTTGRPSPPTSSPPTSSPPSTSPPPPPPHPPPGPPVDPNVPPVTRPPFNLKEAKYACTLVRQDDPICSCAIISNSFALSGCNGCMRTNTTSYVPADFTVRYAYFEGGHDDNSMAVINIPVRKLLAHDSCYDLDNTYMPKNDIGIIQVTGNRLFPTKYAISLPLNNYFSWDLTKYLHLSNLNVIHGGDVQPSEAVWKVFTLAINGSFCTKLLGKSLFERSNICIGYQHVGGADNCATDVGSALALKDKKEEILVGLLINKVECGAPRSIGGCVRMTTHIQWIRQLINKHSNGKELV